MSVIMRRPLGRDPEQYITLRNDSGRVLGKPGPMLLKMLYTKLYLRDGEIPEPPELAGVDGPLRCVYESEHPIEVAGRPLP